MLPFYSHLVIKSSSAIPPYSRSLAADMAQKAMAADLMRVALSAILPQPRGKALAAPAVVVAAPAKDFRDCIILEGSSCISKI